MRTHRPLDRSTLDRSQQRDGYSLVELLIVIMIAVMLMAIALPMAKTVMEDARPREASRIFNTTVVACKARAAQTGRLAGVEFVNVRLNDPNNPIGAFQCTQMYMCEVPAMYMGDTTTAVATVDLNNPMGPWYDLQFQDQVPASPGSPVTGDSTSATLNYLTDIPSASASTPVNSEDVFEIRFDHRGPWYVARRKSSANQFQIQLNGLFPISATSNSSSNIYRYACFQVRRPPVRIGNAIELPRSTCIDMSYSGIGYRSNLNFPAMMDPTFGLGPIGMEFATAKGLRIMFAPTGGVHSVAMAYQSPGAAANSTTQSSGPPQGTIHFLIGLTSKVNTYQEPMSGPYNFNDPTKSNLADGNALWVSVSRISGVVTTNENAPPVTPDPNVLTDPTNNAQKLLYTQACRRYATAREQKGGR